MVLPGDVLTRCVFHCSVHTDEVGACGGKIMAVIHNTRFHTERGAGHWDSPPKKLENYDNRVYNTTTNYRLN